MPAYVIATVRVNDPETYKKYTALTPAIVAKHGGRFLVRGGPVEMLEGTPFKDRLVVLEFPSDEAIRTFYASSEYQEAAVFRKASSKAVFMLAHGVSGDGAAPDDKVVKSD